MDAVRIQSRFVVASPTSILHPGQILIRDGRIVEISQGRVATADADLGDCVVLPGLVNAHTHLEFSQLERPFPAGETFPEWISAVIQYRLSLSGEDSISNLRKSLTRGLSECFMGGTAVVADIVTPPWQASLLPELAEFLETIESNAAFPLSAPERIVDGERERLLEHLKPVRTPLVVPLLELLGLQQERFAASCHWAEQASLQSPSGMVFDYGLSPHAPYSLPVTQASGFLQRILSAKKNSVVAMHVAESREELQWCSDGQGPFADMFQRLNLPAVEPRPSIDGCIELLSAQPRSLLVHGNYLADPQIQRVANAGTISVVYCPRTHAHFKHSPYPLASLQRAGVRVVFGTDSRASNPDLSLWDEMNHVHQQHPDQRPAALLHAITLGAAESLGVDHLVGSLAVGKLAFVNVVNCRSDWTPANLLERLCSQSAADLNLAPLSLV